VSVGYTRSVIQGDLDRFHLGDLLQWLQMGALTGRLSLIEGGRERRLDFFEGRVVFASSNLPRERLGTWLARQGVAPALAIRHLLGISLLRRTLFTNVLIDTGTVSSEALRSSLTELARTLVTRVLFATEVRFVFDSGYPVRDLLSLDLNLQPNALVMEAARRTDESQREGTPHVEEALPFRGEAFERFFWALVREGVSGTELLDGEQVVGLHQAIRDIMTTLAQWLQASPGLVPIPAGEITDLSGRLPSEAPIALAGLPHAAWNQMVLACAVECDQIQLPERFGSLEQHAHELDLWVELTDSESWCRPHAGRLDDLTRRAAYTWSLAAAAAAPHLGLDPDQARLAAHLLVVPTDLVLWVLAALPLPHQQLRHTLVRRLPQRLGTALALRSSFPSSLTLLWEPERAAALGACLHLSRDLLPSASLWPSAIPDDETELLEVATPSTLTAAAHAARAAVESIPEGRLR
jgi:hypothetical protein